MNNKHVAIFTMEKVGSSTVKWALEQAGYTVDRVTPHNMGDFQEKLMVLPVITMVRDPMAQMCSYNWEYPDTYEPVQIINRQANFMDELLPIATDIDLDRMVFDNERGWHIYNDRLLIIQTERLTNYLGIALSRFLGSMEYLVEHRAKGVDKFGPAYLNWVGQLESNLDDYFLDIIYGQAWVKKYFTEENIAVMRSRWQKTKKTAKN